MFVNNVISSVRSVDDSIACSCLHSVTQRAQNTVFSAGQRVSFTAFYRFRLRMGQRFKGMDDYRTVRNTYSTWYVYTELINRGFTLRNISCAFPAPAAHIDHKYRHTAHELE